VGRAPRALAGGAAALYAGLPESPDHCPPVGGSGGGGCLPAGRYVWTNVAALLMVLSNFLDHTDGELARMTGKTSRFGHLYDLASDALVTMLLFFAMGVGLGAEARPGTEIEFPLMGAAAGSAVAFIFYIRMRIEDLAGKTATRQASLAGFETEDVLYLIPLVTLTNGQSAMLVLAAICAPLYALWSLFEYRRLLHRSRLSTASGVAR
jgi:archaetidylinositol phosphate synthase